MAYRYRILPSSALVLSLGYGEVTLQDLQEHATRVRVDPDFDPGFRQFIDFRGATFLRLTADDVRLSASFAPFAPSARRVLYVPQDFGFGMARMYQARMLDHEGHILVTRDEDEGWRHLGFGEGAPERAALHALLAETLSA